MAKKKRQKEPEPPVYVRTWVGTTLTVLSGLSFLWVCMLLPLVGQAGAATPFARQNRTIFIAFLVLSMLLSVGAIVSKLARRKRDQSPPPLFSFTLCGLGLLLLVALMADLLRV